MTTTAKPVHVRIIRKLLTVDDEHHGHPQTHDAGALVALTAAEAAHLVDAGIAERAAVEGDPQAAHAEPGRTFDIRLTRNATSRTWSASVVLKDLGIAIVARDWERSIALVALEDAVEEVLSHVRED